jgi:hypothetical protein
LTRGDPSSCRLDCFSDGEAGRLSLRLGESAFDFFLVILSSSGLNERILFTGPG